MRRSPDPSKQRTTWRNDDARWFTQPELFDAERFAPEKFGAMQRTAYIPLGLGPHVCLGKALSTIILTTMLAGILRKFRISLPPDQPDVEPVVGIVLSPRSDLRFTVRATRQFSNPASITFYVT